MREGLRSSVALRVKPGTSKVAEGKDLRTGFELNDGKMEVLIVNELEVEGTLSESEKLGCGKNADNSGDRKRATEEGSVCAGTDGVDVKRLKGDLGDDMVIVEKVREKNEASNGSSGKMAVKADATKDKDAQCRRLLRRSTRLLRDEDVSSIEVKGNVGRSESPVEKLVCEMELDQHPSSSKIVTTRNKGEMGSAESNVAVGNMIKREKMTVGTAVPNGKVVQCLRALRRSTKLLGDDEKDDSSIEVKGNVGRSESPVEKSICEVELDQDPNSNTIATPRNKGKIGSGEINVAFGDMIKSEKMAVETAVPDGKVVQYLTALRRSTVLLEGDEKDDSSIEVKGNEGPSGSPVEKLVYAMELDQDPSSSTIVTSRTKGEIGSADTNVAIGDMIKRKKMVVETAVPNGKALECRRSLRPSTVLLRDDEKGKSSIGVKGNTIATGRKKGETGSAESNGSDGDMLKRGKCKRGRPPMVNKVKSNYEAETNQLKRQPEINGKELSPRKRSKHAGTSYLEKQAAIVPNEKKISGKFIEKQLIKERIVDLLLEYGWKIEKRPRKGRDYEDSVYVSPEGRGYWSATLAYSVLKSKLEDGEDNRSSTFTPIPEEIINMLTRITTKGKKKKISLGETDELNQDVVVGKKPAKKNCNKETLICSTQVVEKSSKSSKSNLKRGAPKSISNRSQQEPRSRKRCGLLVRDSKNEQNLEDGCALYPWKRMVLTWMIDSGIVPLNEKVQYFNKRKTQVLLEGIITRDGIKCGCCEEVVSVAEFESHSGSKLSQPLQNIFVENGTSLLQCQIDSWNKQEEFERSGFHYVDVNDDDRNDDTCGICGDGGDLICCDTCPSTFHQSCLEIQNFPAGDWNCVYCLCKSCGLSSCKSNKSDDSHDISGSSVLTCHMCEERYHRSCIQIEDSGIDDPGDSSFCGEKCKELSEKLQMLLGVQQELGEGFSWSLNKRSDIDTKVSRSLMPQKVMSNSKLAVAFAIMDECFLPLSDYRTGVNLIRNVVYNSGSNFNRLNYSGFYTAILERGDEIISAASIRIHGCQLAEMPFIGTRHMYRRQGMCSRLLNAIERALGSLKIEKLVIPAITELMQTWTSIFGFKPLEKSTRQEMKCMNMLTFPGVDMLQKPLLDKSYSENIKPTSDSKSEAKKADDTKKSNERVTNAHEIGCETNANACSQLPNGFSNASLDITINCPDSGADPNHLVHLDTISHTPDIVQETMVNYEVSGSSSHEANGKNSVVETDSGQNVASSEPNLGGNCLEISGCNFHERNEQDPIEDMNTDEKDVSCSILNTLDKRISEPHSEPNEDGNCLEISACNFLERDEQNSIEEIDTDQNVVSCSTGTTLAEMITGPHAETNEEIDCVDDELTARQDAFTVDTKTVSKVRKEDNPQNAFCDSRQLQNNGHIIKDGEIDRCITSSSHVDMTPSTSINYEESVHGANGPCETFTYAVDCQRNIDSMFTEPGIETYIANICSPPELTVDALEAAHIESRNGDCSFDVVTLPDNDHKTDLYLMKPNPESHSGITTANVHVPSNPYLGDILLADPKKFAIS